MKIGDWVLYKETGSVEEDFPCEKVLQGEFEHLQERVNSLLGGNT